MSIGPDGRRLENVGDFNVDLALPDLQVGANTLEITAFDGVTPTANSNTISVTVEYVPGAVPGFPYTIDWSALGQDEEIQDVAQAIDGKWTLDSSVGVRTAEAGYDRNLGFGDVFWNDYEVTVPVVFHTIPAEEYGTGVILRWNGHTDFPPHLSPAQVRLAAPGRHCLVQVRRRFSFSATMPRFWPSAYHGPVHDRDDLHI